MTKNIYRLRNVTETKLKYHPYSKSTIRSYYDDIGVFCIELLSPIVEGVIWYDQNDCTYYYRTMTYNYHAQQLLWFLEQYTYDSIDYILRAIHTPCTNIEIKFTEDKIHV